MCNVRPTFSQVVRRIDVPVRGVKWSDNGDLVAILSESSFYVLAYDREVRCYLSSREVHVHRVRYTVIYLVGCFLLRLPPHGSVPP